MMTVFLGFLPWKTVLSWYLYSESRVEMWRKVSFFQSLMQAQMKYTIRGRIAARMQRAISLKLRSEKVVVVLGTGTEENKLVESRVYTLNPELEPGKTEKDNPSILIWYSQASFVSFMHTLTVMFPFSIQKYRLRTKSCPMCSRPHCVPTLAFSPVTSDSKAGAMSLLVPQLTVINLTQCMVSLKEEQQSTSAPTRLQSPSKHRIPTEVPQYLAVTFLASSEYKYCSHSAELMLERQWLVLLALRPRAKSVVLATATNIWEVVLMTLASASWEVTCWWVGYSVSGSEKKEFMYSATGVRTAKVRNMRMMQNFLNSHPSLLYSFYMYMACLNIITMSVEQQLNFVVIFLQEDRDDFLTLPFSVPPDKKVKDLHSFLRDSRQNPFGAYFLTNRIKEKPQFSGEKLLKEVVDQCRRDGSGRHVLLCYEEKQTAGMSKIESSSKHIKEEKDRRQREREKEKEDDSSCLLM